MGMELQLKECELVWMESFKIEKGNQGYENNESCGEVAIHEEF
jgi:hypothetical protein